MPCRIVLVRPHIAGNIGATARVMRNFGLSELVLVAPEADPLDPSSKKLSTHGEEILHRARIVPELGAALADCVLAAATSARLGGPFRQAVGTPEAIMPKLVDAGGPVALVFGPEATGLENDEVTRCHFLIHIPTDPGYRALNLAQSVAICLYELHRHRETPRANAPGSPTPLAPVADQERAFDHLRAALHEIHFLYGPNADSLMHGLRHLIGRARPTKNEVDILFGLARQIRWYVSQHDPERR
jgi:tRNA/rRNA methyltransferase